LATTSAFAALYAVLGAFPISKFVLGSGFLTASDIVAPVGGMLLGPVAGGFSTLVGDVVDTYSGFLGPGPIVYAVMAADLSVVALSGMAFIGRRKAAILLPLVVLALYALDPISLQTVGTIPFAWLHMLSFVALGLVLFFNSRKWIGRLNPIFVVVVTWAALMCGQLTGTLVGQNLMVRFGTMTVDSWRYSMSTFVFPAYPIERVFYTATGSVVAIPILRAVSQLRGKTAIAS
jgi:hypothetical protein